MLKERWNSSPEENLLVLGGKSCSSVPNSLMLTFPEWIRTHLFIPVKLVFSDIVASKKQNGSKKKKRPLND